MAFPTDIPSFNSIGAGNYEDDSGYSHRAMHNDVNALAVAVATKVGIDADTGTATHDYKLSAVTGTAKALPNYNPQPTGTMSGGSSNYYEYSGSMKHNGTIKYDKDIWVALNRNVKVYNGTADAVNPHRTIILKPGALRPTTTSGCGTVITATLTGAGTADIDVLPFGSASNSKAYLAFRMPSSWDGGTCIGQIAWIPAAGTTSQTAIWGVDANCIADGGTVALARPTQGTVVDAFQGTAVLHTSGTFAFVPGGSASGGNMTHIEVSRLAGEANDNLAGTAYLIELMIQYGISKYSDD